MRVIAGTLGGRWLRSPAGNATRPTPDRVREALFSSLGDLEGRRVVDLFAGSGALGIEALSRGAASCLFVERDRRAMAVVRENLFTLGLARPRALTAPVDWGKAIDDARASRTRFDLCLVDPPYGDLPRLLPLLAKRLPPVLAPGARVVIESPARGDEPIPPGWEDAHSRHRTYGSVRISVLEPTPRRTPST